MSEPPLERARPSGVKGEVTTLELDRRARSLARRSAETRAIVPSVEWLIDVDFDEARPRQGDPGVSLPLVVFAAAQALRAHPRFNGAYRDGRYELYSRVNIAVALPDGDGQVLATTFDADRKSPGEIAAELSDLSERAAAGKLTSAELSGATFTISDAHGTAALMLTPLIQPPQAAALAVGPLRSVPVVRGDAVVPGHTMTLTLACDHRIAQGAQGAAFLQQIKDYLEEATL